MLSYCHYPKVILDQNDICVLDTEVNDVFRINGIIGNYTIEVLNEFEQVVQTITGVDSVDIDLTQLSAGMYFVRITHDGNSIVLAQLNLRD